VAGKFQLRSRNWDVITVVGFVVLLVAGYGGILLVAPGTPTLLLLVLLGTVTFLLFAGPGIAYSARKRIPFLKKRLPGSTMVWIRAHMYLPILAVVAAFVHATDAPFRGYLSSGKLTLLLGLLVAIAGWYRHRLLGIETEALNVKSLIGKLISDQDREFRLLVGDLMENRRPLSEIEAEAAKLSPSQTVLWNEIRELVDRVERHFPRTTGGQTLRVRHYKLWRFLHVPLTIILFVLLAYHIFDVLGGKRAVLSDAKGQFAASSQCAGCHAQIFGEWGTSSMGHAQTSTIMEAQLPVTIAENKRLVTGGIADPKRQQNQKQIFDASAKTCINCHAQVGARFAQEIDALLPLAEPGSAGAAAGAGTKAVEGGGAAVQEDGVGCIVCHTQAGPPPELAAAGELGIGTGAASDYGTQFGPLFKNPDPLPVRVHEVGPGKADVWNTPIGSSQLCGACHNVKLDLNGNGVSAFKDVKDDFTDATSSRDSDGDFQLDQNELDVGADGRAQDLVLQTTFDEWQDYVVGFAKRLEKDTRPRVDHPLGCVECHMPTRGNGKQAVVEHAPGLLSPPDRLHRSHSFVGVDYDLDPAAYTKKGLPADALKRALAERKALLSSAVTLEVVNRGQIGKAFQADVIIRNNLLGHAFPTGFAFARQFWLEVSAETASGQPVCLLSPDGRLKTPCSSGVIKRVDEDLRQCDPASVRAVNPAFRGDEAIKFAASFPADDCDPWLANFQKILTDGDPDGDGTFNEVPYQSFLPDIVKNRTRVALQLPMTELQPIRLRADAKGKLNDDATGFYPYLFDNSRLPKGEKIVVRAKLRFRHLPPDFVRALATRLDGLKDIPEAARIDPDKLLENMVITDVVETQSDKGQVLACEGPQNKEGATILDCLGEGEKGVASGVTSGDDLATASRRQSLVDHTPPGIAGVLFFTALFTVIRRRWSSPSVRPR
jgi:hypothetical protein